MARPKAGRVELFVKGEGGAQRSLVMTARAQEADERPVRKVDSASLVGTLSAAPLKANLLQSQSIGGRLLGLLLCLLSWPLSHLSKKAMSMVALLVTALVTLVQRVRQRDGISGGPRRINVAVPPEDVLRLQDPEGGVHEVLFVGDPGVGKTALCTALKSLVPSRLLAPPAGGGSAAEGEQPAAAQRQVVIVWTSQLQEPMKAYALRWQKAMAAVGGHDAPTSLVCNMADIAPCPLPEIHAMRGTRIPSLAVSAVRGTNLAPLWLILERSLSPEVTSTPSTPSLYASTGAANGGGAARGPPDIDVCGQRLGTRQAATGLRQRGNHSRGSSAAGTSGPTSADGRPAPANAPAPYAAQVTQLAEVGSSTGLLSVAPAGLAPPRTASASEAVAACSPSPASILSDLRELVPPVETSEGPFTAARAASKRGSSGTPGGQGSTDVSSSSSSSSDNDPTERRETPHEGFEHSGDPALLGGVAAY